MEREANSVSEQLGISDKEVHATAERMRFLMKVKTEGTVHEHTEKLHAEWKELASRLVKGKSMLELPNTPLREIHIYNLYQYILKQIGIYDLFFASTLPRAQYEALRESVLRIMKE